MSAAEVARGRRGHGGGGKATLLLVAMSLAWVAAGCHSSGTEKEGAGEAKANQASPARPPHANVEALASTKRATARAELMVEGVSCASCTVAIRRELKKLDGVMDIREGSTKKHLLVDFDEQRVSAEQIIDAVHTAGYEAEVLVHSTKT